MLSPFHALFTARELSAYAFGKDRLTAAYASSDIEVYPYQVAAAMFALRSPYLKGVILADEGSLGKTYETLLIISQMWFEGKERTLLVVPTPLLGQWVDVMTDSFSVPFQVCDAENNSFDFQGIILTTYDFAVQNAEQISSIVWATAVFEEAHKLSNHESKTAKILKNTVGDAYKLLLTATPIQNSIMDLYGLLHFIDDGILGDADEFYKRYFRKPENYHELTSRVSRYVFRTLRSQVEGYVKIPKRLPVTSDYPLSAKEVKLAALVGNYLEKTDKSAFPKMDSYDLTLMFWRAVSSSPWALCKVADTAVGRVKEPELVEIAEIAADIQPSETGKGKALLKCLKKAFAELKKCGANRKVIIFTESLATIGFLHVLLSDTYKTLAFDGSKSSDYSVIKKFEKEAEILITTNVAAEGFNLGFCSMIVNYDLPYNVLTLEQRIMRCHRQGQKNDVIVLNFLSKNNLADTRMLELINKRVSQFDGIIGMSDDVIGNFTDNALDGLTRAFEQARHSSEIERNFQSALAENKADNTEKVAEAENVLFTTFTRDIAQKITVTPQYIADKAVELNTKLWELVKWFFTGKIGYKYIDETRTLTVGIQAQKVFTGTALRRREYSMNDRTLTLTSAIAKNVICELFWKGIPDSGTIKVEGGVDCRIAYYRVKVSPKGSYWGCIDYYVFVGKTANNSTLTDKECRRIMDLPVVDFTADLEVYGERDVNKSKPQNPLDCEVQTEPFLRQAITDTDSVRSEEIANIQDRAYYEKQSLNRSIPVLKNQLLQIENALSRAVNISEKVTAEKKKSTANRELKQREQSLFLDSMKIDVSAEEAVKKVAESANLCAEVTRQFVIKIEGIFHE